MAENKYIEFVRNWVAMTAVEGVTGWGDVAVRLPRLMEAWRELRDGSGAFGCAFPPEIAEEVTAAVKGDVEASIEKWRLYMEANHGADGKKNFDKLAKQVGLRALQPHAVPRSPRIRAAVERMKEALSDVKAATAAWKEQRRLEPGEHYAFAFGPPPRDLAKILARLENDEEPLPDPLAELYAEIGGIWVGAVRGKGGEKKWREGHEYYVLAPFSLMLAQSGFTRDLGYPISGQPDTFAITLLDPRGAVRKRYKLDGPDAKPKRIAKDLSGWLDLIAATHGLKY